MLNIKVDVAKSASIVSEWRRALMQVKWSFISFVAATTVVGVYGVLTTSIALKTWLVQYVFYLLGLLGMGAGYHRLYSHRTFKVARSVELFLLFWATTDFSMSAINWVKDHRAHHKYTDTDKDPYNSKRGFFYSHMGWLMWKRERPNSDVSDLERDPVLMFQHKYFYPLAMLTGWILPMLLCGLGWGDWQGGFYATIFKTFVMHHCIFSINSLAHFLGDDTYSDVISARDSLLCAIITSGEGYHNFHHEFPNDYRNGIHLTAYDPTKWFIAACELVGLVTDVKRTSPDQIKLNKLQVIQRRAEQEKKKIFTGIPLEQLPFFTKEQIKDAIEKRGACLIVMGDLVYDVKEFIGEHPGGRAYIQNYLGKDMTNAFSGSVYAHSLAARNLLQTLRCGRLTKQS